MLSLLTNVQSLKSQRQYNEANKALTQASERIASGKRINSAKDDASGLQLSNRMTSQINGLEQGNRNASDAIAFCQTTEGALDEVTTMLQRMRTLALQSSNGTNSDSERTALQEEVDELVSEIARIGTDTTYGANFAVLGDDNNNQTIKFQVGANAGQTIDLKLKSISEMCQAKGKEDAKITLDSLSLESVDDANSMITALDAMIKNVDSYRSTLGAKQNRLESTISNQSNVIENVSDARSRIRDTDFVTETAKLTASQIQQQTATSILAQANQNPSLILSLLQ